MLCILLMMESLNMRQCNLLIYHHHLMCLLRVVNHILDYSAFVQSFKKTGGGASFTRSGFELSAKTQAV